MAQPHSPNSPASVPLPTPVCPTCDTPMRLARVEPHPDYVNLDQWTYVCGCGMTSKKLRIAQGSVASPSRRTD
jgi:hypothetical protein